MDKKFFLYSTLIVFILSIFLCGALVEKGEPFLNIAPTYGPEQIIDGTATFSLEDEPANSIVSGEIEDETVSMALKEFLDNNSLTYTCNPSNCFNVYTLSSQEASKNIVFSDNGGHSGYSAVKATGTQTSITDLKFNIRGSSGQLSCGETPLKLDILDDGIIDWEYREAGDWCGSFIYGKEYNPSQATEENLISSTPYCEKIEIDKTSKVLVSAEVKYNSGDNEIGDLVFSIYDGANLIGSCEVPKVENTNYQGVGCEIYGQNFYIKEKKEMFLCVKNTGSAEYAIKAESVSPFSGFYGNPSTSPTFTRDYAIYGLIAGFAPFNQEVEFNSTNYLGTNLQTYLQDYLVSRYNRECSDGCAIPLKFIRTDNAQNINLNTLHFSFNTQGGPSNNNYFYSVAIEYPLISMGLKSASLNALNIKVPANYGTYSFLFKIGSEQETSEIEVAQVPIISSLTPLSAVPGEETNFEVVASSPKGNNIVKYVWDFGDGTTKDTTTNSVSHTYSSSGSFNLIVKAIDSENLEGSRTFKIDAILTKEGLNNSIKNKQAKISTFLNAIKNEWFADYLEEKLKVNESSATLNNLYSQLNAATETQLVSMKSEIDALDIPVRLENSLVSDETEYFVDQEDINPELVQQLGGGRYDSKLNREFINAIAEWLEKQKITVSGKVKAVVFDDGSKEDIFSELTVDINLEDEEKNYLIVSLPGTAKFEDILFEDSSINAEEVDDSFGISLNGSKTITFLMPGKNPASSLKMFDSPELDTLKVSAGTKPSEEKKAPWGWIILFIILIISGTFAALLFIWKGKKVKREKQLFKNPMDMFNITNFIKSAQARGMSKQDIEDKLLKAGWQKSQIAFAYTKI